MSDAGDKILNDAINGWCVIMREKKITQRRLAEMAGINENAISAIMNGISKPNVITFFNIDNALKNAN